MNIYLTDTRYLSIQEFKDSSKNTSMLALTDDEIQEFIVKAELEVDTYIGYRFTDFLTLTLIEQQEVKIAVLSISEYIYAIGGTYNTSIRDGLKSETSGDRSVSYGDNNSGVPLSTGIPDSAKVILSKYKNNFYSLNI